MQSRVREQQIVAFRKKLLVIAMELYQGVWCDKSCANIDDIEQRCATTCRRTTAGIRMTRVVKSGGLGPHEDLVAIVRHRAEES